MHHMLLKHTLFYKLLPFVVRPPYIFIGTTLSIELAANAMVANDATITLLCFHLIHFLFLWLSLSMLIVIPLTLHHWYRDSEMVVWFNNANIINNLI